MLEICTDVQRRPIYTGRTGTWVLQALRNDPQEDAQRQAQRRPSALHEATQPLWDRQQPLALERLEGEVIASPVEQDKQTVSTPATT